MKIKVIVISVFVCGSFQQLWSQEAPKMVAFSISEKAPENTSKIKTTEPVMAIWHQDPNKNNSERIVVPELATFKVEDKINDASKKNSEVPK